MFFGRRSKQSKINLVIFITLIVLVVITLSWLAVRNFSNWQRRDGDYAFKAPKGWERQSGARENVAALVKGDAQIIIQPIEADVDSFKNEILQHPGILMAGDQEVCGQSAWISVIESAVGKEKSVILFNPHKISEVEGKDIANKHYSIKLTAPKSTFDSHLADLESLVCSFNYTIN